jgi:hypothetical protein
MSSKLTAAFRCISLTLALAFGLTAASQTASLSGAVRDSSHAVVVGASISIARETTGLKQKTSSSEQGFYFFAFLMPGSYTITAEAPGFGVVSRGGVKLDPGQEARLDFTLSPAAIKESVTVRGSSSSLQTESSAVGTEVDPQLVQDLPLNGRTFQSLIGLAPGVVRPGTLNSANPQTGSFINGQRSNYFTVDGVSANLDGAGGTGLEATVLGTTLNLVSIDDMQEFKLQTSTYSAAYGRAAGGQLEIVTRSGSNQYHGSVFDYFRNEALDANDWFSNFHGQPRAAHRQNDFGGSFGGPILKNRTFFFFSYEGLRLRLPQPFGPISVPSLSARQAATGAVQQLLNAFALPNGPEDPASMSARLVGNGSDQTSSDNTSIRIDHEVNQKVVVFGRYSEAPSASNSAGFGSNSAKRVASFRSATLGATLLFSPKATSDLRVNYSRTEGGNSFAPDRTGGAVPPPDSLLFPAPFASPSSSLFVLSGLDTQFRAGRQLDNLQRQGNFVSNTSILQGAHEVRFGVDYRYLAPRSGPPDYRQRVAFSGVPGALTGVAREVDIGSFDSVTLGFHDLSLYGQDSWKVSARFTLIYGLRWELNLPPHARGGQHLITLTGFPDLAALQLAPAGTPVYKTTYANFAPRVGAAYQLFQHPGKETVIRGGFGRFYDLGVGNIGDAATSLPRAKVTIGAPYPLSSQVAAPPPSPSLDPPYAGGFTIFGPDHQLPRSYHWNLTIDQRLGASQVLSASYVGEAGRRLLRQNSLFDPNPRFPRPASQINVTTNTSSSDYHALQIQFQRRMARRLAALLSYTWSHSIDDTSNDIGFDNLTNPRIDRGSSDFDARHAFNAALSYDIPVPDGNRALRAILGHWSTDSIFTARTALPINVSVDLGLSDFVSNLLEARPDRVPGIPLYIHDSTVPEGRRLNSAAFSIQSELRQGNLERNLVRGLPLTQLDFDVRRQFGITDRVKLQLRADFFNLFNHPNFGLMDGFWGSLGPPVQLNSTFGFPFFSVAQFSDVNPLYSVGGPRSIQLSLRLSF